MPDPTVPTSESLTLSATLFHADVDSWLPANFGVSQPESSKAAEWESALRSSADRAQRLGLGHAALEDAALGAKMRNQRAGLSVLEQKLKKRKAAVEDGAVVREQEGSEEEAESRTRSIKTNKKAKDPFAAKGKVHPALAKKETKVHPALLKGKEKEEKVHPAILAKMAVAKAESAETSAEEKEGREEPSPPTSLGKRPRDDSDDENDKKEDDGPVLSKAERKREKKRKQKLRKAAEAEAAKAS